MLKKRDIVPIRTLDGEDPDFGKVYISPSVWVEVPVYGLTLRVIKQYGDDEQVFPMRTNTDDLVGDIHFATES